MIHDIKYISSYGYQFLKLKSLNASALYGNIYLSVDMASPKPNELKDRKFVFQTPLIYSHPPSACPSNTWCVSIKN